MSTPMDILMGGNIDERKQKALSNALRRKKEISQLALLSGDDTVGRFGGALYSDVEDKVTKRLAQQEKQAQRDLTKGYYDQMAGQFDKNHALNQSRLAETIRHNKAMEGRALRNTMRQLQSNTRNLARDLTKANIPEVQQGIDLVNQELQKYEGKNIPGMGGFQNTVLGRTSEEGRHMQSLVGRIRNIILKARSGGAVTPQEAERLMEEFNLGITSGDNDFRKSWADFQSVFNAGVNNVFAGYDPETINEYVSNYDMYSGLVGPQGGVENQSWEDLDSDRAPSPEQQSGPVNWGDMK